MQARGLTEQLKDIVARDWQHSAGARHLTQSGRAPAGAPALVSACYPAQSRSAFCSLGEWLVRWMRSSVGRAVRAARSFQGGDGRGCPARPGGRAAAVGCRLSTSPAAVATEAIRRPVGGPAGTTPPVPAQRLAVAVPARPAGAAARDSSAAAAFARTASSRSLREFSRSACTGAGNWISVSTSKESGSTSNITATRSRAIVSTSRRCRAWVVRSTSGTWTSQNRSPRSTRAW